MNREIKFRAWDSKLNKFIPAHQGLTECLLFKDGFKVPVLTVGENEDYKGVVIMQYTGLKDKNGVEIYEGDVVEVIHGTGMEGMKSTREKRFYCEVIYQAPQFVYRWPSEYGNYRFGKALSRTIVIGNKFENPELINN